MAERPTTASHGILAGHLADCLWDLLQELGVTARPVYQGYLGTYGDRERWRVEVLIYANMGDEEACHTFDAPLPRDTFFNGIQDAAREAIRQMRDIYAQELQRTTFRYFPSKYPASSSSVFSSTEFESNPRLVQQVQYTKSLDYVYQDTLKELSLMAQRLREAEEELAKYRVEDEGSSITGPPPKKLKNQPSISSSTSP